MNKAMIKQELEMNMKMNHKDAKNNFMLQSNHYRFNRMKEGGWGSNNEGL